MVKSGVIRENDYSQMKAQYGIDKVFIEPGTKFGDYKIVKLEVIDELKTKDESIMQKIAMIKGYLHDDLRNSGIFKEILVDNIAKASSAENVLVLKIVITRIDMGNHLIRGVVGFSAGATNVSFEGEAIDGQSDKRLMYFSDSIYGADAFSAISSDNLINDDIKAMTDNIIKILTENR